MFAIPNHLIKGDLSDEAFAIIAYLCAHNIGKNIVPFFIDADMIEIVLYGDKARTREHRSVANGILKEFEDVGIISKHEQYTKYVVNPSEFSTTFNENGAKIFFSMFDASEFLSFYTSNLRNKWGIFHLFCLYVATFKEEYNYRAGKMSVEYFAKQLHVTPMTISKYTNKLEEMKLLYVRRGIFNPEEGARQTNLYGRYADQMELRLLRGTDTFEYLRPQQTKFKQSVAMKYRMYCKNPDKYSYAQRKELLELVERYNELLPDDKYARPLDTSVFNLTN